MSEWLKEHAWKACVGETLPWVRIPLSPPDFFHPTKTREFPGIPRVLKSNCVADAVRPIVTELLNLHGTNGLMRGGRFESHTHGDGVAQLVARLVCRIKESACAQVTHCLTDLRMSGLFREGSTQDSAA